MAINKINNDDNISFFIEEDDDANIHIIENTIENMDENINIHDEILHVNASTLLYENSVRESNNLFFSNMIHYNENCTVKELMIICDYYGISKEIKSNKYNKEQIIQLLVSFESNYQHQEMVYKRKNMWFYINELKNDKYMKKYILW